MLFFLSFLFVLIFSFFGFVFVLWGENEVGKIGTGENLRRVEERENLIKIYCMKKIVKKF